MKINIILEIFSGDLVLRDNTDLCHAARKRNPTKKIPTEKALCIPFGFVVHQTDVKKFLWKIQSDFAGASSS